MVSKVLRYYFIYASILFSVTLSGDELFGYGSNVSIVRFGGVEADIIYSLSTNSSITVRVGEYNTLADTSVNITIVADNHAIITSTQLTWTYLKTGEILSVSPSRGQFGSLVTITGINLLGGGTNITQLYIDGVAPMLIVDYNSTRIMFQLGDESTRDVNFPANEVYIESNTGAIIKGGYFLQLAPGMILSFSPVTGRQGTVMTINGYNLTGYGMEIVNVVIGGYSSISTSFQTTNEDSRLVIQVGPAPNGTSDKVRIIIDTGAIIESNLVFKYVQPGSIDSVLPTIGAEGVGILIEGISLKIGLLDITSVTIGGSQVMRIVTTSFDHVSVIAGPAPTNLVNQTIMIVSSDGSFVEGGYFTYQNLSISINGLKEGQYGTQITLMVPFPVTDLAAVYIGDQKASIISIHSVSMTVNVTIPRATMIGQHSVDVAVERENNVVIRLQDGFTYLPEGIIDSVEPNLGQKGTSVSIKGERLLGGGTDILSVTIGNIPAEIIGYSNDVINVTIGNNPSGITNYPHMSDIRIISNTGAIVTRLQSFSYIEPGQITSFTPSTGQYGTVVTIKGNNLLQGGTVDIASVLLAGIEAILIGTPNDTYIQVQAMSSPPLTGSVTITLSTGAVISSTGIEFQYQATGNISTVTPAVGTVGTMVTITGTNLLGGGTQAQTMMLNGVLADVIANGNSHMTVRANVDYNITGDPGAVIIISETGSIVMRENAWTYEKLGDITSFTPQSGQQGINVLIGGVSLIGTSGSHIVEVTLAGIPATITFQNNTMLTATAGYSNISLTGPIILKAYSGPIITSNSNWSYYEASIVSASPTTGVYGTYVTLDGVNIIEEPGSNSTISNVTFGTIEAYNIVVLSQNSIQVRAGNSDVPTGPLTVQVTLTSGIFLTLQNQWSYLPPGRIASVEPVTGAPGENITIYGSSLVPTGATSASVTTGDSRAFEAVIVNTSVVQFRTGVYQSVDAPNVPLAISIESNDGSIVYNGTQALFSFNTTGDVTVVYPIAGGTGSTVEINGTNLLSGSTNISNVFIAGIAVADIISYSDTRIVVTVGPGSNVTGTVIIESGSGLFTGLANQTSWSYLPALNSTHVSPLYGSNGTVVTIATSLIPSQYVIQSVSLAGIEALVVSASNDQLVVMAMQSSLATPISDITLVYQDDIKLIISDSWRYLTPPSITNTSTSFGYYKSIVVINGLGFQGGGTDVAAVFLAGFDTRIIAQSDTQLTVVINEPFDSSGSGNITGPIVVAGDDGSTHTFSDSMFTYLQVSVESVTPNFGQYGTIVTIKGIGLLAGGTVVSSMSLANVSVENVLSASNSEIKVVASLSSAETGPSDIVYITNTGALVTITTSWSYVSPGSITSITPPSGQQGRIVTITGKGMLRGGSEAVEVLLSGVASMEILVSHDDFIQVRAGLNGPAPAGEVTIISNTGAQITSNVSLVAYEYLAAGNITSLIPSDGQYGTRVSIGGTGLYSSSGINYVTVSNVQADILSYNSTAINIMLNQPTIITSMEGPVRVVSVDGSIVESSTSFTYLQVGQIHLVHPQEGQRGANVTIAGDRLRGGGSYIDTVLVSGIPADIAMESDTELMVTINENVDSYNSDVTGDIVIISDTGSAVKRIDGWTYTQVGSVQTISPASGQYGTFVTITGERLVSGGVSVNEVYIGNVPSLEVVSSNETVVIFRAGETNSSFNGSISLISNYNSNLTSLNMTWMYLEKSQVLLVEPSNSTGGMIVNITGRNLLGGGTGIVSISLAGIEVRNIIAFDDTYIEIETGFNPDGQPKAGDIRIESNTGALTIVPDGWVYESECPLGQYGNNTNSCSPCHTECDHCHGPTQFNCYSCKNFKIIHDMNAFECVSTCPSLSTLDKECVDNCTSSQYQQISTLDGQVYCLNCHPLCDPKLSCRGPLPSECTACTEYAERGECVTGCSIGSYVSNGTCLPCHEQCLPSDNCTGPASYDCNQCTNVSIAQQIGNSLPLVDVCITECPTSYYIDHNSVCQLCHSECRGGCTGPLRTNCNECLNAYIRHSNTIECVAACNAVSGINTMYQDPLTGECKSCHRLCSISSGCTGPSATDCILCSNFTGSNVATDFIPLFDGECVHTCPNESYYIELRNGNCELCDPICTIGCTGPASSDCIPEPTSTPTDNTVGPFQAGPGAIAIVVVIAVVLVIALIILIVVLIVKLRKRDRYRVDNAGNVEHSLEPVQQAYRRNPISETNIDIIEEPRRKPLQQQIQYKGLSFEHVEVSENNPAYTEVPRTIELLEEDEKSLGKSIENLHDTDRPSSPLSDVDETTNLLNKPHPKPPEQSDRPPPIPKKASKSNIPVSHQEVDPLQFLPEPNLDGEFEPTELYTEMDDGNNLTQDVYTEMDPPTSTMISEDADDFYEETDAAANTGYGVDYRTAQEVMASHPPLSSDKPPVIPRRDIEVKPALPPRMKKGSTSNVKK